MLIELIIILFVSLIVLGPEEFPNAIKKVIKIISEGRKLLSSLKNSL